MQNELPLLSNLISENVKSVFSEISDGLEKASLSNINDYGQNDHIIEVSNSSDICATKFSNLQLKGIESDSGERIKPLTLDQIPPSVEDTSKVGTEFGNVLRNGATQNSNIDQIHNIESYSTNTSLDGE